MTSRSNRLGDRSKSQQIRDSAKGAPCLLRVPNICKARRDTVNHCHIRHAALGGTGFKPVDAAGIRACQECHDWLDDRTGMGLHREFRAEIILSGLLRTLEALTREGLL